LDIKIIKLPLEMSSISKELKKQGKKIGLVPTMGYLHQGHLSLVEIAKKNVDIVVVSIFVNPTQFGPNEDFQKYPRDFNRDCELLKPYNVDYIFYPSIDDIYPKNFSTYVEETEISQVLEGKYRPTHFKGVTTIVNILFNIVKPDIAVFGQKDAQQLAIISKMVKDLMMNIEIIPAPIVRENDGLAMSSRNVYLSAEERNDALVLFKSLSYAKDLIVKGERNCDVIRNKGMEILTSVSTSNPDYFEIVEAESFKFIDRLENGKKYYLLAACRIGSTRLIDNFLINL
jgi:pantoate--beta-alanine ligase